MSDGRVVRDSDADSARYPAQRRKESRTKVRGNALKVDQCASTSAGLAPEAGDCNSETLPRDLAPVSGGRVVSAVAKGRARQRAAEAEAEQQGQAVFQAWWRENRAARVAPSSAAGASGQDRLAAVRARVLARSTQ